MAKMLKDEIQILKSVLIEVDDNTVALITQQYHVETDESTGKIDRSKSVWRWVARAWRKDDYIKLVDDLFSDAKRLERCRWPDDTLSYYLCINNRSTNYFFAKFLRIKLKKLRTWEYGQKVLQGWENKTAGHDERYNPKAKYAVDNYVAPDGKSYSITDKNTFLSNIGVNLVSTEKLKTK